MPVRSSMNFTLNTFSHHTQKAMKVFPTILMFVCKEEKEQPTAADLSDQMEVINTEIEAVISTDCTASSQCMAF